LKISKNKTEYIEYVFEERDQEIDGTRTTTVCGDVVGEIESFKYLGSFVQWDGSFGVDVKHKIKCG